MFCNPGTSVMEIDNLRILRSAMMYNDNKEVERNLGNSILTLYCSRICDYNTVHLSPIGINRQSLLISTGNWIKKRKKEQQKKTAAA